MHSQRKAFTDNALMRLEECVPDFSGEREDVEVGEPIAVVGAV